MSEVTHFVRSAFKVPSPLLQLQAIGNYKMGETREQRIYGEFVTVLGKGTWSAGPTHGQPITASSPEKVTVSSFRIFKRTRFNRSEIQSDITYPWNSRHVQQYS